MGKRFWNYVRTRTKDAVGVPTLLENGIEVTETKEKTETLSRNYDTFFTTEDMTNMPNKGDPQTPQIDPIIVTVEGVEKLLAGLNSKKQMDRTNYQQEYLKNAAMKWPHYYRRYFKTL